MATTTTGLNFKRVTKDKILGDSSSEMYFRDVYKAMGKMGKMKTRLEDGEAYALYHKVGLSRSGYEEVRTILNERHVPNPFPSLRSIRQEEKLHASRNLFRAERIQKSDGGKTKDVVVVQIVDLEKFLVEKLENLAQKDKLIFDESTGNNIWICISGDKGGGEFKLCATIGNVVAPNSAYHIVPLGMFTDDEKVEAIKEYLADTIEQLNNLIELKLNIGGVTTSYPVEHDGRVKIGSYERGRCLKARTETNYLLDSANEKNTNSVIPGSSFVFNNVRLANIVPPSLHILMGVAHRYVFKFLLDLAMDIDNKSTMKIDKSKKKAMRNAKGDMNVRDVPMEALWALRKSKVCENAKREKMRGAQRHPGTYLMNVKEKEYNGLKQHLDSFGVVLQVMSRFKTSTIIPAQSHTSPCSAEWCLFRDNEMKKAGVFKSTPLRCATCSEVNHAVCSGLWSEDDWELLSQVEPDMDCLRCCGRKGAMIEEDARKVEREMREKLEEISRVGLCLEPVSSTGKLQDVDDGSEWGRRKKGRIGEGMGRLWSRYVSVAT
ncbi:hypothetical protein CRE_14345 [Caenorhabditis remanei]|uniref:Zinc finger PHD-type domain-containing protein n=1 Tax=Caenorhabditis remanei TaxID=31234 RepID=E3NIN6_CAERE|nr:hypothetical protein CRE_14345 [Caenorhabditis remanei]